MSQCVYYNKVALLNDNMRKIKDCPKNNSISHKDQNTEVNKICKGTS